MARGGRSGTIAGRMTDNASLTGRVAIVTGGSRGIGAGIVERLASDGAAVAFTFHQQESRARALEAAVLARGGRAWAAQCDVADEASVTSFVSRAAAELGPVDILVNNAGVTKDTHVLLMDEARWDEVVDVNLRAAFVSVRAVVRGMLLRRWGRIINISSPSARMPLGGQTAYSASKAGLEGFTRALSRDLAGKGVLVNAVSPGLIDTEMVKAVAPEALARHLAAVPLGRLGTVQEVAAVVAFLVSDAASYVTGQVVGVNGGLL